MYTLQNNQLTVDILDPIADRERFGTRYCTGGYIYQISDARYGPLLTGPTYPNSFNTFDGQGIPDAFNLSPLREPTATNALALIIGIGLCDLQANQVQEFCQWTVEQSAASIRMSTMQAFGDFALTLTRTVTLYERTVRSALHLHNTGKRIVPVRWFPHPFYPQPETDELCKFNIAITMPENSGYVLNENGFIARHNWPEQRGYFQALNHAAETNLVILQKHPILGLVTATCSYVPAFFPIWGNQNTFSWEPYLERSLAFEQAMEWWIDYDF